MWKDKRVTKAIIIYILVMILIPVVLFFFVDQCESGNNNIPDNEWLSFWGTYLGACLGGVATIFTLIYTIKQYIDEREARERENEQNIREERRKQEENRKYELLVGVRPFLVVENASFTSAYQNIHELEGFAHVESEEPLRSEKNTYCIDFILKNIGNAPLLNLNLNYEGNGYCVIGFGDFDASKHVKNGPEIVQKLSIDIAKDEAKRVRVMLNMTEQFEKCIREKYYGLATLGFVFEDIAGHKIIKIATIELGTQKCIGWKNQEYRDANIRKLFG